ncbi:MAG TPA: GMC family oxidoreductase, partial [Terriglobales bacterium]|nr:GMC family oxidoreductase [Terriglobales bacterium]
SPMLENSDDAQAMVEAMHFIDELVHKNPAKEFYGGLIQPGPAEDWRKFARSTYDSYHHGVGTCKMGPATDEMAVVDQKLRVHGMKNLWVGDASIMPVVSRANTNLAAILIGERLSTFVKEVA